MILAKIPTKWLATMATAFYFASMSVAQAQTSPQAKATNRAAPPAPAAKGAAGEQGAAPSPSAEKVPASAPRRDPFLPLISEKKETGSVEHLPPGKAGLVIATVRVDGAVRSEEGMIAVLSNSDQGVYFVREGDRLYDGDVEKIGLDGVTFRQNSKDAFGKPVERVVTKRIYASAGEQQ